MEVDCFVGVFDFMSGGVEQQQGSLNGWELVSFSAGNEVAKCFVRHDRFQLPAKQIRFNRTASGIDSI